MYFPALASRPQRETAYVDLNPIRAAMCETLEESDYTSAQRRIESLQDEQLAQVPVDVASQDDSASDRQPIAKLRDRRDSFLSPVSIDELLDWTARQVAPGKRGQTPADTPPILQRLGLDRASWCEVVSDFGKLFCTVAGNPECVDAMRSHRTHRRFHLRRRARELFADCG